MPITLPFVYKKTFKTNRGTPSSFRVNIWRIFYYIEKQKILELEDDFIFLL